jgi:hypothetical protein
LDEAAAEAAAEAAVAAAVEAAARKEDEAAVLGAAGGSA